MIRTWSSLQSPLEHADAASNPGLFQRGMGSSAASRRPMEPFDDALSGCCCCWPLIKLLCREDFPPSEAQTPESHTPIPPCGNIELAMSSLASAAGIELLPCEAEELDNGNILQDWFYLLACITSPVVKICSTRLQQAVGES